MLTIYFISGHLDLTQEEFDTHYKPKIDQALASPFPVRFVVADARGADTMAQTYLRGRGKDVTVFHMLATPRNNVGNYPTVGGFKTDEARDTAMTEVSDEDIAWVRPGREKSGTQKNLLRRVMKTIRPKPDTGDPMVYLSGVLLIPGRDNDYTLEEGQITFWGLRVRRGDIISLVTQTEGIALEVPTPPAKEYDLGFPAVIAESSWLKLPISLKDCTVLRRWKTSKKLAEWIGINQ